MSSKIIERIGKAVPRNRVSISRNSVPINRENFYPRLDQFIENPTIELPTDNLRIYRVGDVYYCTQQVVTRSIRVDDLFDIQVLNSEFTSKPRIDYIETNLVSKFIGYYHILDKTLTPSMFKPNTTYLIIADGKIGFVNSFYDIPFSGLNYIAIYESAYDIILMEHKKVEDDNTIKCPVCHNKLHDHEEEEDETINSYFRLDEYRAVSFVDENLKIVTFNSNFHPYYFKPFTDKPIYAIRVKVQGTDMKNNSLDLYVASSNIKTLSDFNNDDNIRHTPNNLIINNLMTNEVMFQKLKEIKTWNSQFKMQRAQASKDVESPIVARVTRKGGQVYTAYVFEYSMDFIYLYNGVIMKDLVILPLTRSKNSNGYNYSEGGSEVYIVLPSWNYELAKIKILRPSFTDTYFNVVDGRLMFTDNDNGTRHRDRILLYHYYVLNFKRTSYFDIEHFQDLTHDNVIAIDDGGLLLMEPTKELDDLLAIDVLESSKHLIMAFKDSTGFIANRNTVIKDITSLVNPELLKRGVITLPTGYVYLFINNRFMTEDDLEHIGGIYFRIRSDRYQFRVSNIKVYIADENSSMLEMRYRAMDFMASLDFYSQESIENHIISSYAIRLLDNNYEGDRYYGHSGGSFTLPIYNHLLVQMGMMKEMLDKGTPEEIVRFDLMVDQLQDEFPYVSIRELFEGTIDDDRLVALGEVDSTYKKFLYGEE